MNYSINGRPKVRKRKIINRKGEREPKRWERVWNLRYTEDKKYHG